MKHRNKIRLARKLRTPEEASSGVGLFYSKKWRLRKLAIRVRVYNKQLLDQQRAIERKARRGGKVHGQEV